jgi:hypothetical protein
LSCTRGATARRPTRGTRARRVSIIAGVTLRANSRGWSIRHRRRVIFSGETFDEFLAEFFPSAQQTKEAE